MRGTYGEVLGPSLAAGDSLRTWGSRYARLVFERCGRNKRRACRILDISYHTLQGYLRHARTLPEDDRAWAQSASRPPAGSGLPSPER